MSFIPPNKVPHIKVQNLPSIRQAKSRIVFCTIIHYSSTVVFRLLFPKICSGGIILTKTESRAKSRSRGHRGHG
jgi:hypothetical protein